MFSTDFYSQLYFADGSLDEPNLMVDVKSKPADFIVDELMEIELTGEGEHIWLNISKAAMHTNQVVKAISKLSHVHQKNIGISGMKDFRAKTTQWFSVWMPGVKEADLPDWTMLNSDSMKINRIVRHSRKLKRGTHIGNRFNIVLRNFEGEFDHFEKRIESIKHQGVPNYFGEQRFGINGSNLNQAYDFLSSNKKVKQRQKRSMLLSSARSWLFNSVLSERLRQQSWLSVQQGEPLIFNHSRQFFICDDVVECQERVDGLDVHTTAPLWGIGENKIFPQSSTLQSFEYQIISQFDIFQQGLIQSGLDYSRRALRFVPSDLSWNRVEQDIELTFILGRGLFATSLLRELVKSR